MFRKITTRVKILLGFTFITIVAGFVGIYGIQKIKMLNERNSILYGHVAVGLGHVADFSADLQKITSLYCDILIDTTKVEESVAGNQKTN